MLKHKKNILWLILGLLFLLIMTLVVYNIFYIGKIYYGVKIDNLSIAGKNKAEAENIINSETKKYLNKNLRLVYGDTGWNLEVRNLVNQFDNQKTADKSYLEGRQENFWDNFWARIRLIFKQLIIPVQFVFNEDYLNQNIERIKSSIDKPLQESSIEIINGRVKINHSQEGVLVNTQELKNAIKKQLENISEQEIKIPTEEVFSSIQQEETNKVRQKAEKIITYPVYLNYGTIAHQIGSVELGYLMKFNFKPFDWGKLKEKEKLELKNFLIELINLNSDIIEETRIELVLNEGKTKSYLSKFADKDINIKPQNAVLGIRDGSVVVVKPEINGKTLDLDDIIKKLKEALFSNGSREISLKIIERKAEVRTDNYQELGIKELIGSGYSNFAGSPPNRIHNITVGAAKVNGSLIKPGDAFSLNEAISLVDASTGFLPELVIKERRTVPEYGGGLCQIGTTCFRAALNSCLPILERQNHAYIVQYYAPTGTDATIYPPHPDVIFRNNTGSYILVQSIVSGNILTFDFYGTKGEKVSKFNGVESLEEAIGRVEDVNPHVYNQKADGSAEAEFYRFIFEREQLIKTERFYSQYESPAKYPH
jgi:vancomycin resistance protein YoaR